MTGLINNFKCCVLSITTLFFTLQAAANETGNKRVAVGTIFFDMQKECLGPLLEADANGDYHLDRTEYVSYVQSQSPDPMFQVGYADQPNQIIIAHLKLTCPDGGSTCTDDLPLAGAELGLDGMNDTQELFIYNLCSITKKAMFDAMGVEYPTAPPTPNPSAEPSSNPTAEDTTNVRQVDIPFGVANMKGLDAFDIAANVDGSFEGVIRPAFEDLGQKVEKNWNIEKIGGSRMLAIESRRMWIESIESVDCPQSILDDYSDAVCQKFNGKVEINAVDENADDASFKFSNKAQTAIGDGDFQGFISDPVNYKVFSITGEETSTSFPLFAIVGVAAGAVLVGLFAGRALVVNRRRRGSQLSDDEAYSEDELQMTRSADIEKGVEVEPIVSQPMGESVAVGTYRSPGKVSFDDSSSNAGSSGWSSSAGVSSLNTGSVDSVEYFGSSLAAIGAASKVHTKYDRQRKANMYPIDGEGESSDESDSSEHDDTNFAPRQLTTREDLEKQIQAGDWAAVGATAAILASDQRSNPGSLSSGLSESSSGISSLLSGSSRERLRAAELDRLVEAGDWEGVVLTAAKFEADDRDDKTYGSVGAKDSNRSAADRSFANSSANSPSVSTNISDTMSNNHKRAEIRAEVEALVRRVVPDEIENVDEMMSQFQGREEELLETLRTMQERSIAARQREASRRNAKREAKKLAKESKKASALPTIPKKSPDELNPLVNPTCNDSTDQSHNRMDTSTSGHSSQWAAVGRTADQIEKTDYASSDTGSQAYLSSQSRAESERAAELTGLIQEDDWSGVVAAATKYNDADAKSSLNQSVLSDDQQRSVTSSGRWRAGSDAESDDGTDNLSRREKKVIAKEEEEARAQAQIWSKIAEQSKVKGSTAVGASDAADWAISRKLKEIQESAVEQNQTETQSVASSNDDNSV